MILSEGQFSRFRGPMRVSVGFAGSRSSKVAFAEGNEGHCDLAGRGHWPMLVFRV